MFAAWEGHLEIARLLLDRGAAPNRQVRMAVPILLATQRGWVELMRLLIARGARIRVPYVGGKDLVAVIVTAAQTGSREAVQLLLDAGEASDPDGSGRQNALMAAAQFGHVGVAELLIHHGADVTRPDARGASPLSESIHSATQTRSTPERERLVPVMLATNPPLDLHMAAAVGDVEAVRRHLDGGSDIAGIDRYGQTALEAALRAGRTAVVELLLDRGAQADGTLATAVRHGRSATAAFLIERGAIDLSVEGPAALVAAAREGYVECAELLLDRGVDPNSSDGRALEMAVTTEHMEVARLLLRRGADADRPSEERWTPLMHASSMGNASMAELLLRHGADPSRRDGQGRTALEIAEEEESSEVAAVLRAWVEHRP
jgi:serine/threonine-protein phosphatase 6 regulatory ankyrin repeat subunit B